MNLSCYRKLIRFFLLTSLALALKVAFVNVFFYEFSELVAHDDGMPFGTAHTLVRSTVSKKGVLDQVPYTVQFSVIIAVLIICYEYN